MREAKEMRGMDGKSFRGVPSDLPVSTPDDGGAVVVVVAVGAMYAVC